MNNFKIVFIMLSFIITTSCSTYDPYTGEKKTSSAAKGAGIGAGAALALSYFKNRKKSSKERNKRLLRDAGIGAIIGGGVGFYMDTQEAKLRKKLRNSGVSVKRDGNNINLIMPGNVTFATNESTLKPSFHEVLDSVALVLIEFKKTNIVVAGYTDSVGSLAYNQELSERRAASVSEYLSSKNVTAARLNTVGFGEKNPVADNKTENGRALNRRVEITLLPITNS